MKILYHVQNGDIEAKYPLYYFKDFCSIKMKVIYDV